MVSFLTKRKLHDNRNATNFSIITSIHGVSNQMSVPKFQRHNAEISWTPTTRWCVAWRRTENSCRPKEPARAKEPRRCDCKSLAKTEDIWGDVKKPAIWDFLKMLICFCTSTSPQCFFFFFCWFKNGKLLVTLNLWSSNWTQIGESIEAWNSKSEKNPWGSMTKKY